MWSFFLKSLGVLVLRYHRHDQEYKFPLNLHIGGTRNPGRPGRRPRWCCSWSRSRTCSRSRSRPSTASRSRSCFFILFTISERINAQQDGGQEARASKSSTSTCGRTSAATTIHARPGCVLVAVRDYNRMPHLQQRAAEDQPAAARHRGDDGAPGLDRRRRVRACRRTSYFRDYEKELFTRVVTMAEKEGKTVDLLVVPGVDPVRRHGADGGEAAGVAAGDGRFAAHGFGGTGAPHRPGLGEPAGAAASVLARNHHAGPASVYVNLGPHPPRLWPEDLDRAHELWLRLTEKFGSRLHHRDVVGVALRRLEKDLENERRAEALKRPRPGAEEKLAGIPAPRRFPGWSRDASFAVTERVRSRRRTLCGSPRFCSSRAAFSRRTRPFSKRTSRWSTWTPRSPRPDGRILTGFSQRRFPRARRRQGAADPAFLRGRRAARPDPAV